MPEVKSTIRVNTYSIVMRALDEGLKHGWNRVWRYHEGTPISITDEDSILDMLQQAVSNELCEVLIFDCHDDDDE